MKVFLKGYINKNLGDDLFIKIVTDRYKNVDYKIYGDADYLKISNLKSYKPTKTTNLIDKVLKIISLGTRGIETIISNRSDLMVLVGGSMFIERKNSFYFAKNLRIKKPYFIIGSNFGPYYSDKYFTKYNDFFKNAVDVCFRDDYSRSLFKNLENVRMAPDIVFSLNSSDIELLNSKRVIISVIDVSKKLDKKYQEAYMKQMLYFIKYFNNLGYAITLMSFCSSEGDETAINNIIEQLDSQISIDTYFYDGNIQKALNVLGDCEIIVGSRFHANILGIILNKVIIPLAYSDKTVNVLKDINYSGKIIDIRKLTDKIVEINDNDLSYIFNSREMLDGSMKHFNKLDEYLTRGD